MPSPNIPNSSNLSTQSRANTKAIRMKDVIAAYSTSRSGVYRAIERGDLTPRKVAGCSYFSVEQCDKLYLGHSTYI